MDVFLIFTLLTLNMLLIDEEGLCVRYIKGYTPEQAIRNAFKWCLDKGLITNPTYIK